MTTIVIEGAARVTINPPTASEVVMTAFERAMQKIGRADMAAEPDSEIREGVAAAINRSLTPPRIGEYWHGQGGIYAGLARGEDGQPDYHLILATEAPEHKFTWAAAKEHAKAVEADGHRDFTLPKRFESALLYANLRDKFDANYWYWTDTEHSAGRAFVQRFYYGDQGSNGASFEARARFVRRLML